MYGRQPPTAARRRIIGSRAAGVPAAARSGPSSQSPPQPPTRPPAPPLRPPPRPGPPQPTQPLRHTALPRSRHHCLLPKTTSPHSHTFATRPSRRRTFPRREKTQPRIGPGHTCKATPRIAKCRLRPHRRRCMAQARAPKSQHSSRFSGCLRSPIRCGGATLGPQASRSSRRFRRWPRGRGGGCGRAWGVWRGAQTLRAREAEGVGCLVECLGTGSRGGAPSRRCDCGNQRQLVRTAFLHTPRLEA